MKAVLQLFWHMCLLRQSPEHVPTQNWFVATVISANILCSILLSVALDTTTDVLTVVTRVVVGQATNAALVWLALYLREHVSRFPATITALFGCDLIITVWFGVLVPLIGNLGTGASSLFFLGFILWSLAVAGFILHRALSVRLGIGIMVAVGTMVFSVAMSEIAIGNT